MKLVFKMLLVTLFASAVVGCASTGDVEQLQTQIDGLKTSVSQVSESAKSAQSAAEDAKVRSEAAELAATRAAQYAIETNTKLDSLFRKAMVK